MACRFFRWGAYGGCGGDLEVISPRSASFWADEGYGVVGEIKRSRLSPYLAFDSLSFGTRPSLDWFFGFGEN